MFASYLPGRSMVAFWPQLSGNLDESQLLAVALLVCKLTTTSSRSSPNRSAYVSSVTFADLSPSIRCSARVFTPADTAGDAQLCRKSCGVIFCTLAFRTAAFDQTGPVCKLPAYRIKLPALESNSVGRGRPELGSKPGRT
jgi:hypothetical protein